MDLDEIEGYRSTPPPLTPPLMIGSAGRLFGSFARATRESFNFPTTSDPDTDNDSEAQSRPSTRVTKCCPIGRIRNRNNRNSQHGKRNGGRGDDIIDTEAQTKSTHEYSNNKTQMTPLVVVENATTSHNESSTAITVYNEDEQQPIHQNISNTDEQDVCTSSL